MLREWNDDITNNALFITCIAACEKINTPWAGRSVEAKVRICRQLVQQKKHTVGLFLVRQQLLEMQAFCLVLCSIDAASVQILSNATLMLIVVCYVPLSSHLSTLNFTFAV